MTSSASTLDARHQAAVRLLADLIIPPSADGRLPGASAFDVAGYLAEVVPETLPALRIELDRLDADARARHGRGFDALDAPARAALVDALRAADPAFLATLALETASCYYQQDAVLAAIGVEPRPPAPQGFQVLAGDLSLLAPVRRRGRIWRDAP
jgi:hypothetical protein